MDFTNTLASVGRIEWDQHELNCERIIAYYDELYTRDPDRLRQHLIQLISGGKISEIHHFIHVAEEAGNAPYLHDPQLFTSLYTLARAKHMAP